MIFFEKPKITFGELSRRTGICSSPTLRITRLSGTGKEMEIPHPFTLIFE